MGEVGADTSGSRASPLGTKWLSGYILSIAVASNLIVTIPVVLYTVFRSLELQYAWIQSERVVNSFVRVAVTCSALAIAIWTPYFLELMGVISTTLLMFIFIFIPVAVAFSLFRKKVTHFGIEEIGLFVVGI